MTKDYIWENDDVFTLNMNPGISVYGELLKDFDGVEYRRWDPYRSKLAALIKSNYKFETDDDSTILYLGAASGTTVSHISDIADKSQIFAVEFSARPFRDLLMVSKNRENIYPLLADAKNPLEYSRFLSKADILYQDISQKDQVDIFLKNLPLLKKGGQFIFMIKSRSIDVSADPMEVYKNVESEISPYVTIDYKTLLMPWQKDHMAITGRKR